jgi:fluoroacetyl-CoA thioesterase
MIQVGEKHETRVTVTKEMTAAAMGSGALEVFATPSMIALMEGTAQATVQSLLEDGQGTVGTRIDVKHLAATPVGMKVTCVAEVTEVDRRRIVFSVKAYDEVELIGEGTHDRFVINNEKFFAKCNGKMEK